MPALYQAGGARSTGAETMHSALFVAFNARTKTTSQNWAAFLAEVDNHVDPKQGALRLSENVWLLNLQTSLTPLGHLLAAALNHTISHAMLPFERAPEWLPADFDPTSIPGRSAMS
jgi:hypothetical protein